MAFELKTSDDLGILAQQLRCDLRTARQKANEDPFYSDVVVINSRGMEHWLVQQLAGVDGEPGIQANLHFVTPNELVEFLLSHLDGKTARWDDRKDAVNPYDRDVLAWRMYRLLGEEAVDPESPFSELTHYFHADAADAPERADRRRYQLAVQLADVYDQYQIHRPHWLRAWLGNYAVEGLDLGRHDWQPELWRRLAQQDADSRDVRIAAAREHIGTIAAQCRGGELRRVWLFGVSTMAPCVLALLRDLGGHLDVSHYLHSPSACYWLDDRTARQATNSLRNRLERRLLADRSVEAALLAASLQAVDADIAVEGNPLLASCGDVIREFLRELMDQFENHEADCRVDLSDDRLFRARADGSCLLAAVKESIRLAEQLPDMSGDEDIVSGMDASMRFHSCHGPLREIEVLRDNLLDWFNDKRNGIDKHPRHVVVMAPNIEEYVPFIEAVFNRRGRNADTYLPYLIADRTSVAESAVVQAFLNLLRLPDSRFRASEVFDLLGVGAISRACKLDASDVVRLQRWVKDANVHWGLDAEHRRKIDPSFEVLGEAYSWQFGMDRLLAGYGIGLTDGDQLFENVAPLDEVEGGEAACLGRFCRFLGDLREARQRFGSNKPVAEWKKDLEWALDRFFVGDEHSYADLTALRQHVERLARNASTDGAGDALPAAVVVSALTTAVSAAQSSSLFCRGRITFCSMLPMRSIPADFVWLLGMNDGAFPRTDPRRDFNLIHMGKPMACDRSRRKDDRYLFLEALTSARHRFHVSYIGRDDKDNSTRPPSALVRELMNELRAVLPEACDEKGELMDSVQTYLVVNHRLHAFADDYFNNEVAATFTYSMTAAEDAATHLSSSKETPCLFGSPKKRESLLPQPANSEVCSAVELAKFFSSPGEELVKRRLSLYLGDDAVQLDDEEPLRLGGLEGYALGQRLLNDCSRLMAKPLPEKDLADAREKALHRLQAEGGLPPGALGEAAFGDKWSAAEAFTNHLLGVGDLKLAAVIALVESGDELPFVEDEEGRKVRVAAFGRLSPIKAKDQVTALVRHLAANAVEPQETFLGGWDKYDGKVEVQQLNAAAGDTSRTQAQNDYAVLLKLHEIGMRLPLPFSPGPSFAYGKKIAEQKENSAKAAEEEKKAKEAAEATDVKKRDKAVAAAEKAATAAKKAGRDAVAGAEKEWLGDDWTTAYDGIEKVANRYCYGAGTLLGRPGWSDALRADGVHLDDEFPEVRFEQLAILIWEIWTRWGVK